MLSTQHRLRNRSDIERVYRAGKNVFGLGAGLRLLPNELGVNRFAISVGVKISKSAVVRGTLKRQYREHIKAHLAQMNPGHDILVILTKDAAGLTFEQQAAGFTETLQKAKLLAL